MASLPSLLTNRDAQPTRIANQFTFADSGGAIRVKYYPNAPGPLAPGGGATGSQLEYEDHQLRIRFSGSEVLTQETVLGRVVTVTLHKNADAGTVKFALIMPSVVLPEDSASEQFHTIAIKISAREFANPKGSDRTYSIFQLTGTAESLPLPL